MLSDWGYSLQDLGIGPDDCEPVRTAEPAGVVVTLWLPVEDYGRVPSARFFPLWRAKWAHRWAKVMERIHGPENVTVDYE